MVNDTISPTQVLDKRTLLISSPDSALIKILNENLPKTINIGELSLWVEKTTFLNPKLNPPLRIVTEYNEFHQTSLEEFPIFEQFKMKKKAEIEHLANWYFGNFCAKCGRIDSEKDNHGRDCWDKLHSLKEFLPDKMTHREFINFVRNGTTFCKPIPREFHECPTCRALGVPQQSSV